jgi:hypothetical protein
MSDLDSASFEVGRQIIVFLGHAQQHPFGLAVRDRTGQPTRSFGLFPIKSRLLHDVGTPARAAFAQWRSLFFAVLFRCRDRARLDGPLCGIEVFEPQVVALDALAQFGRIEVLYWLHMSRRDRGALTFWHLGGCCSRKRIIRRCCHAPAEFSRERCRLGFDRETYVK